MAPCLAYLYIPNGVAPGTWEPEQVAPSGELQKLNRWMAPLEDFKSDLIVTKNLWTPRGNGHVKSTATWLTGGDYDERKIDVGSPSADQIAAQHLHDATPLPSLELSTLGQGSFSGDLPRNCLSWKQRNIPAARETIPRAVFDKLFRRPGEGFVDRSVLDLVLGQSKALKTRVSSADERKIDEYLDAVRAVEKRLDFAEEQTQRIAADKDLTNTLMRPAAGIPADHQEYVRQMLDLMALSFWSGATRVATFMLDHGQSNRYFNFIPGVQGTWHALSHWKGVDGRSEDDDGKTSWKNVESKVEMYNTVNRWHHAQVAYFLARLKALKNADGSSTLDRSMIVYGSSLADGNSHEKYDLPILLAGGGAGKIKTGRYLAPRNATSLSQLHLALLQNMGVPLEKFGETDTPLAGLQV